jgi:hypothetical protein
MSMIVVAGVALLAFLYVRANRRARQKWLTQLDLPGTWHWEQGDAELRLSGYVDRGDFVLREAGTSTSGTWSLRGNTLKLNGLAEYDLQFFKPGSIGLEPRDAPEARRIYVKQTSNVVPLKRIPH